MVKTMKRLAEIEWEAVPGSPRGREQMPEGQSSVLFPAISWGDPPESQIPPRKTPKIQKNIKKCIEFTPQICVPPRTWSLE